MNGPTDSATFFYMWIGFLFLMIAGILLVFIWAIRSGQFKDQDRARYLPLSDQRKRYPGEKQAAEKRGKQS
ncbi:cbb3-type cytochrome oxidase assembly protein [Pelotalea chapellei]|uniref:Cbb3-type cytochrome oxidase assembly protein CcoS n=1 Tax=Pelotalea chapellei TaxID=44671 RepID=A0ABS5U763_9BACT|nr:cbb3-type cytochrome oxidase assembly protein [Pelotalea chapellei]MBT1071508.1 cbb3-type cytochrome oxidase assembly protein CcoS [Pelotalea chapellei]